jgi:hypothetical protein
MPITKVKVIDSIQVNEWGSVFYRESTQVIDIDGSVLGERNRRSVIHPGEPIQGAGHPQDVSDVCNIVHTQARIDAWNNRPQPGPQG